MEKTTHDMDKNTILLWSELPEVPPEALAPQVQFASYWSWGQPYASGEWEIHNLQLFLLVEGGIRYCTWDTRGRRGRGTAYAGDLLVFFPGRKQYETLPDRITALYQFSIIPAVGALSRGVPVLPGVGRVPHRTAMDEALPRLAACGWRMLTALNLLPVGWQLEVNAGALELLLGAFRAGGGMPPPPPQGPWEALLARMDAGTTIPDVRTLAESMGYSPNHFTRLFRQRTGTTPKQYLLARRLARARECLARGCSVQEASRQSGFDDPLYFIRLFRQFFGTPPSRIATLPAAPNLPNTDLPINRHLVPPGSSITARYLRQGSSLTAAR